MPHGLSFDGGKTLIFSDPLLEDVLTRLLFL